MYKVSADTLYISYANPLDSTKTLQSVWTLDLTLTTTTSPGLTYKYSSGDPTYKGDITLVKNLDSAAVDTLIGLLRCQLRRCQGF